MGEVLSEAIGVLLAPETVLGTAPAADWTRIPIRPGGLQNWEPQLETVELDNHDINAVPRKGDNVGLSASPTIVSYFTKDLIDKIGPSMFRCVAAHIGGKDQSQFRPTAAVDGAAGEDSFTVATNGDLQAGLLIQGKGWASDENNALHTTVVSVDPLAIKVATGSLVAEVAPANATLDIVGFVGAAADYSINADGNLACVAGDFTTFDIPVGMTLQIGGTAANSFFDEFGSFAEGVVESVTAKLITFSWRSFTVGTGDGTGKTIQVFASRLYRNYAINDTTNHSRATLHGEVETPGSGTADASEFTYLEGLAVNTVTLNAPLKSAIEATVAFVGMDIPDPVLAAGRVAGPSDAYAPLAYKFIDTANDLRRVRLTDASGTLVGSVNSWTFTANNNVTPKEEQATFGAVGHHYGEFMFSVTMSVYFTTGNQVKAARDNRDLVWHAMGANHQFGFAIHLPNVALRNPRKTLAKNQPVTMELDIPAFGDDSTNIACAMTVYGHIPEAV